MKLRTEGMKKDIDDRDFVNPASPEPIITLMTMTKINSSKTTPNNINQTTKDVW